MACLRGACLQHREEDIECEPEGGSHDKPTTADGGRTPAPQLFPSTVRGYILAVKQFADYFGKPPDRLGATDVQRFQWYLLQENKLDPGTVALRMSALRFFFKKMLKRRDMHFDDLPFPKTPRKLPQTRFLQVHA